MSYSGKSTIGKLLSDKLNYNFIDTDRSIEQELGLSVNNIFEKYGEGYFRKAERKIIDKLLNDNIEKNVISTGGGMPIFFDNITVLKKIGLTIFLDVPLVELKKRINSKNDRPLLKNHFDNKLIDLYYTRRNIYLKSHVSIRLENMGIEDSLFQIIKTINDIKRNE